MFLQVLKIKKKLLALVAWKSFLFQVDLVNVFFTIVRSRETFVTNLTSLISRFILVGSSKFWTMSSEFEKKIQNECNSALIKKNAEQFF